MGDRELVFCFVLFFFFFANAISAKNPDSVLQLNSVL